MSFYLSLQVSLGVLAAFNCAFCALSYWLRRCDTIWKVAGSIPDGVIGFFFFNFHNHSSRTMVLELTQPLTEMSTMNLLGVKRGRRVKLTSPPSMSQLYRRCANLDVSRPDRLALHDLLQRWLYLLFFYLG
jgi:hypothetical protein